MAEPNVTSANGTSATIANQNQSLETAPGITKSVSIEKVEINHPLEVVSDLDIKHPLKVENAHVTALPNPPTSAPIGEHSEKHPKSTLGGNIIAPTGQPMPSKAWVHFDDENTEKNTGAQNTAAVIATESVQVNLERSFSENLPTPPLNNSVVVDPKNLRNIELPATNSQEAIRQGFANGDIIVTLLPVNSSLPWITPAKFRPELVPEELMAQGLTLTVEEYVQIMELLVNDYRFTLYNVCYKRVLVVWITLAFILLLSMLFSGLTGLVLFGVGIFWLIINATAIFLSMYVKFRLQRNLERCLANVNKHLMRHKIMVALDDRGKISCHKITLCFIYLDPSQCIAHLQSSVEVQERDEQGWEQRMDISVNDIVIQGARTTRLSRKQERTTLLYLRYAARWGKDRVRGYLASPPAKGGRHCAQLTCPCQYIEDHLQCKPTAIPCGCCVYMNDRNVRPPSEYPVP